VRLGIAAALAGAAVLVPATPASAHGGDTPDATAYRTRITGFSTPERGLTVRTVEAGARLELTNKTGHSVEVLGYSGEPYLDIRPDGTYQNLNSPTAYADRTPPPHADPTAPPSWQRISTSTTARWHDQRTHWLGAGPPPQAAADPSRPHRLREWTVPLRVQVRTFEIRGTLDWIPPPRAWLWWLTAALAGLLATALAYRWPSSIAPLALIGGLSPILYATTRLADGGAPPIVLILAAVLALSAAYRHPPFWLALSGAALALFGGLTETAAFTAAVLPAAGPAWLSRAAVALAVGLGAALTATGILRLRAAHPSAPPPTADRQASPAAA
jgi:hypothetical protein